MKKLLFTIALAVFAVTAFSQEYYGYNENTGTYERITERGPYLTGKFFDNWFIGVAGGVNMYMSTGDVHKDFGSRLAPAIDASLGKWITPSVGMRLQYSGLRGKGASKTATPFTYGSADGEGYYDKKFKYVSFHGDFLWNLSNAIGGYKETRTWDFVPFVGFGFVQANNVYNNDIRSREFAANMGLLNVIRLGEVIDLTLEARYMMTKARFDKYVGSRAIDGMLSVTAGLSFNLGPRGGFKRPVAVAPANYTPYQQRISALENDLSNANDRISRLQRELDACNARPTPQPEVVTAPHSMSVFFTIGSARITDTYMKNLESFANTIKAHPNQKYNVTGYCDAGTGSVRRNEELSRQRAEAVANALVNNYGVNRSQLNVEGKGGVTNHSNPALDRVVIVAQ
ncbi:MAG: OmpA family protein [Rikenellaceae bacterium]|nr:OmpA family protein [Rikenellaceae bacterium]